MQHTTDTIVLESTLRFSIDKWAAWSPSLPAPADWNDWLQHPQPLHETGEGSPSLAEMPAALRRRASRCGRAALQAAYWCEPGDAPIVFASRYGKLARSVEMLEQLAQNEPLSPTAFSLSVHNAIGALFSIARNRPDNYTAIAAGEETVEAAFTEAVGLLADGAPKVTVVYYEAPLPEVYGRFERPGAITHAWACRIVPAVSGGCTLAPEPAAECCAEDDLPADLHILRLLTGNGEARYAHRSGARGWQWRRHD